MTHHQLPPQNDDRGLPFLQREVQHLGNEPGVYRMLDEKGEVLYVGKAKHVRSRVSSYLNIAQLPYRLQRMVMATAKLEIITTRSEAEALLVEANLIKQFRPRYNILLKDDKSYPYIHFSGNHAFPRISKYRGQQADGKYFGPFVSAAAVDEMLHLLQKVFRLRPCSDNVFKHRTRPCLQYQIKRCSAPCVNYISEAEYAADLNAAEHFLKGETDSVSRELRAQMDQASANMHYEKAAELRDRLQALAQIRQQQKLSLHTLSHADIIALARMQETVCIQIFSYRFGSNFGNQCFFPGNTEEVDDAEIVEAFISRHYQQHPPPKQLVLSHALSSPEVVAEALQLIAGHKVELIIPKRGEKLEALNMAVSNTREALARHIAAHAVQQEILAQMAERFDLERPPERIEVYDNSHISGANAVGAMIVATPAGFDKKSYRTYTMPTSDIAPGDDYAMLRYMLTRRLKKLTTDETQAHRPDLLLIDGGKGQLKIAMEVCEQLGISDLPLIAIAKGEDRNAGREWFHMPGKAAFQLPVDDPLLHFLQRLRDEAHRFAIQAHRGKRSRQLVTSELDSLPGIGAKRKKALLTHFGSVRAIRGASIDDLSRVPGISATMAAEIYRYFH